MLYHICIHDDFIMFQDELIPFGKKDIEEHVTKVLPDIFDVIVHKIDSTGEIYVCGEGDAKRMLGRKLEDRLGSEVRYE